MKKHIQIIILVFGAALLAACGATPEKKAEAPKPPVTAADAASAIMAADIAISNARQRKYLWRDTSKILDKADNAMAADEYRDARDLANKAREQAEVSVIQSYRGDARFLIAYLGSKETVDTLSLDQKRRLDSAATALGEERVQVAYETASMIMDELMAPMIAEVEAPVVTEAEIPVIAEQPMPEPIPTAQISTSTGVTYIVNKKDNLWDIAAKAEVYGNADMWPLLWTANKEKINKPDDIATGMSLVIDRGASPESVAAAIKHSKLRGAESLGPVDAFDQQYLSR